MKIICEHCRKQLSAKDKKCPGCGTPVKRRDGLVMTSTGLQKPKARKKTSKVKNG